MESKMGETSISINIYNKVLAFA